MIKALSVHTNIASGGPFNHHNELEQGAFTRPRMAGEKSEFARVQTQTHSAQSIAITARHRVTLTHLQELNHDAYSILATTSSNNASTKASASKGRKSSSCSPTPINRMGKPMRCAKANKIPPLAVPSSLVSTSPVTPTASRNSKAWLMAFWPVPEIGRAHV